MAEHEKRKGNEKSLLEDASTLLMLSKFNTPAKTREDAPEKAILVNELTIKGSDKTFMIPLQQTEAYTNKNVEVIEKVHFESSASITNESIKSPLKRLLLEDLSSLGNESKSEESRKKQRRNKVNKWPISDEYIVDPDSGIITCICGFDDDDGFSIQCDHCNRWQHAMCYNINDMANVPDDYLCNVCQPRDLDTKRARRIQLHRLKKQSNTSTLDDVNKVGKIICNTSVAQGINVNTDDINNTDNNNKPRIEETEIKDTDLNQIVLNNNETSVVDAIQTKKKIDIFYLSAKSSYEAMYLPIKCNDYTDRYVEMFIEKHINDEFINTFSSSHEFKPLPIEVKSYSELSYPRIFPGFTKLGIYINTSCNKGELIHELLGHVDFKKNYIEDSRNHYRIWGTTKPKVFFHQNWPLYIDTRLCSNLTRYIRRSCKPNVEITTIKYEKHGKTEVKFILKALRNINEDEELHLPWTWDSKHIIWNVMENGSNQNLESLNDADKYLLLNSIDTILRSCDCACGNSNKDCNLLKVKKFSQTLFRSVKSKMNNRYKLNEILNQYQGKRRRPPPILTRLAHEVYESQERASDIISEFNEKKLKYLESQEKKEQISEVNKLENSTKESHTTTNECNLSKPYKWTLLQKRLKFLSKEENSDIQVITNPLDYSEDHIDNLADLPLLIQLGVNEPQIIDSHDIDNTFIDTLSSDNILTRDSDTNNMGMGTSNIKNRLSAQNDIGESTYSGIKLDDLKHSNLEGISQSKPSKKKLSFADYRKKLSK